MEIIMNPMLYFIAAVIVAFCMGLKLGKGKKHYDGVFRVNTDNPEKDVFSLELECAIGSIPSKNELIFKVVNESSQEKLFL